MATARGGKREAAADAIGLAAWAESSGRRRAGDSVRGGLRFAVYGRVSTEDWQDPVTSRARQRTRPPRWWPGTGGSWPSSSMSATAGRWPGRAARRPRPPPRWPTRTAAGRGPGRPVRAGLLLRPVRGDGAAVRALPHPAMDPGSRRPSRLARRRSRGDDAGAGAAVQAGDRADPDPGPDRDGDPGARAGPLPGRSAAVRV